MANQYPNSGALFRNNKKVHERSPDMTGEISIDLDLLKELIATAENSEVKLRLSGWTKEGRAGKFLSLKADTFRRQDAPSTPAASVPDEDIPF